MQNPFIENPKFSKYRKMKPSEALNIHYLLGTSFNVRVDESHSYTSQMTEMTMEAGTIISDHVVHKPIELIVNMENTNITCLPEWYQTGAEVARDTLQTLNDAWANNTRFTVPTAHKTYKNMIIVGVRALHRAPYLGALKYQLTMRQANYVYKVEIGERVVADDSTYQPEVSEGNKPVDEVTESDLQTATL